MSGTLNQFQAIGNLKEDLSSSSENGKPAIRIGNSGSLIMNSQIATNTYWTDSETGDRMGKAE